MSKPRRSGALGVPSKPHDAARAEARSRSSSRTASRRTPGRRPWPRSPPGTASLRPQVLKFDQNTPPLPGVAQIPLAESFATLNAYPDGTYRELREAAAAYVSREGGTEVGWEQIVVGAGRRRPHPALRAHLPRAGTDGLDRAADLRALPHRDAARRRRSGPGRRRRRRREPDLALQPRQPDRASSRRRPSSSSSRGAIPTPRSSSTRPTSSTAARPSSPGSTSAPT